MSKMQRTKGANGERARCRWWKENGYPFARRKLSQYQETDGCDIENIGDWVEQVKCGKKINILKAYKEAVSATKKGQRAIASIHYDREETLIVMSEDTFGDLLQGRI